MEFLFLALICLPKLNIIGFESVTQGIRIDDFIVLILFLKIFSKVKFQINHIYAFLYIVIISLIGLLNNYNDFIFLRLMSLIRIFEYIVLYYSAQLLLSKEQIGRLFKLIVIIQFSIVVFQYVSDQSIRPSGTTAGPWELALVCSVAAIFLTETYGFKKAAIYNIFTILILFLASSRAQILAIAFVGVYAIYNKISLSYSSKIIAITLLSICFIYLINYIDYGYINFSRSINFVKDFYPEFIDDITNLRVTIKTNHYDINHYDPSLVSRALQWQEYVASIRASYNIPFAILFGTGANSNGLILDGFYIKIFVDFGILGLAFFIFYIIKLICNPKYVYYSLLISISSLTLDLLWASKFVYILLIAISKLHERNND
jgi:hypothetical protein